ncbi:PQQ-dependent sugar dehydrogenase [Ornithinimicrobium sp. Y1847]|uniref:PQQ-dependent sugar dehydrogenase n=1 Tax=Ornithinimicrobium sp. Y1847 TaxID=3405419 RepID=UPI003B674FF4
MGRRTIATLSAALLLAACSGDDGGEGPAGGSTVSPEPAVEEEGSPTDDGAEETSSADEVEGSEGGAAPEDGADDADGVGDSEAQDPVQAFTITEHGSFDEGWAMDFLPGTDHLLIAERVGALQLRDQDSGEVTEVTGTPEVHHAGQAGLHDVIAGPTFEDDGTIYLSWVRSTDQGVQGVVGRGTLDVDDASLSDIEVLWEQTPQSGNGHFSLRMLVHDDHLFVTSGDRQELDPAQGLDTNLGKVVRLTLDGEPAPDNPWADEGGVAEEFWTLGHRNPLGIAEDSTGQLWVSEMGPQGGDELNLLEPGENYGWPEASMGVHYGGGDIPGHQEGDGYRAPAAYWVPAISPGNLLIYSGDLFTGWQDSALLGGLSGQTLVRVDLDGQDAEVADQWDMGSRIRAVDEAPDGSIWILEDGAGGRLLELRPDN